MKEDDRTHRHSREGMQRMLRHWARSSAFFWASISPSERVSFHQSLAAWRSNALSLLLSSSPCSHEGEEEEEEEGRRSRNVWLPGMNLIPLQISCNLGDEMSENQMEVIKIT